MRGALLALAIGVGVLAVVAQRLAGAPGDKDTRWVWLTLLGLGVLSATYDIACDGYYMGALKKHDQARYSGTRVAAYRAAMLVGSSGLVFLGGYFNWLVAFGIAAGLLGVLLAVPLRKHFIEDENLPFPDGIAAGETLIMLDTRGEQARTSAAAMFGSLAASGLTFLATQLRWVTDNIPLVVAGSTTCYG